MQILRPENKDFGTKWFLYDMGLSLAEKGLNLFDKYLYKLFN